MTHLSRCTAVLSASLLCASAAHAQLATAVGVVVDSVRGRPLVGATIVVSGTEVQAVSDSSGRFRIDGIPPGDHTMAVLHPFLDEMGLTLSTNKITFAPGATMAVLLATPSATTWVGRRCSDAERQEGSGAVMGHVLQLTSDEPVTGALLHYTGTVIFAGKDVGLRHTTITRDASATATGDFIVCGVPPGVPGVIRASKGRVSTGDLPVDLTEATLVAVTLRLPPDDTLSAHAGVVTGRVVDGKGAPVSAARVTLRGGRQTTQATDSGTFTLRDLPLGSQVIQIEKAGFPTQSTPVTVLGPQQPAIVSIALEPPPPSSADARLVSVGFVRRRSAGGGVFITADTIRNRKARYVADLQPLLPGMMAMSSDRGPVLVPTRSGVARCTWYLVDGYLYQTFIAPQMSAGTVSVRGRTVQNTPEQITTSYRSRFNDDWPAVSIVGIEYYDYGHVPHQLLERIPSREYARCSMIAIWTVNSVGAPAS
jgi:hypothetical protein